MKYHDKMYETSSGNFGVSVSKSPFLFYRFGDTYAGYFTIYSQPMPVTPIWAMHNLENSAHESSLHNLSSPEDSSPSSQFRVHCSSALLVHPQTVRQIVVAKRGNIYLSQKSAAITKPKTVVSASEGWFPPKTQKGTLSSLFFLC